MALTPISELEALSEERERLFYEFLAVPELADNWYNWFEANIAYVQAGGFADCDPDNQIHIARQLFTYGVRPSERQLKRLRGETEARASLKREIKRPAPKQSKRQTNAEKLREQVKANAVGTLF